LISDTPKLEKLNYSVFKLQKKEIYIYIYVFECGGGAAEEF